MWSLLISSPTDNIYFHVRQLHKLSLHKEHFHSNIGQLIDNTYRVGRDKRLKKRCRGNNILFVYTQKKTVFVLWVQLWLIFNFSHNQYRHRVLNYEPIKHTRCPEEKQETVTHHKEEAWGERPNCVGNPELGKARKFMLRHWKISKMFVSSEIASKNLFFSFYVELNYFGRWRKKKFQFPLNY